MLALILSRYRFSPLLLICLLALPTLRADGQASFQGLGHLFGGNFTSANSVSADGQVVVGYGNSADGVQAFRWTLITGLVGLGDFPGGAFESIAWGVSADGKVIVGYGSVAKGQSAFRWTQADGMVALGSTTDGKDANVAMAASSDGQVIVGNSSHDTSFLWTSARGVVAIDLLQSGVASEVASVSASGKYIVGTVSYKDPNNAQQIQYQAYVASMAGNSVLMGGLGYLPGGTYISQAKGVSDDGKVVVGWSKTATREKAFRWTNETNMVAIDDFQTIDTYANAVSGDGSIIIGRMYDTVSHNFNAFIWDATYGMRNLQDVLANDYHLNLTGWTLLYANAISQDGKTIVGHGFNPDGEIEAWIFRAEAGPNFITGKVTLQDAVNQVQPLTFEFRPDDGSPPFIRGLTLKADRTFKLTNIPAKSYTVHIKGAKWMAKNVKADASKGNVSGLTAKLFPGDLDGDNAVGLEDLVLFFDSYGSVPGDDNWNDGIADLNCDDAAELDDLILFFDHYGEEGDV